MSDEKVVRALVLSGGGSKGAYQVGVLQRLMGQMGLDYEILCGVSVGAINAAFLAQYALNCPVDASLALRRLWATVSNDKVKKRWFPFGKVSALWKRSVYDSRPLQAWVRAGLYPNAIKTSGHKLRVVSVSFNTGEISVVDETHPNIADWVLASSAFPVMLNPVEIDGQLWTDGGLRQITPLGEAIRAGATDIDVVMCSNPFDQTNFDAKGAKAIPQLLLRAVDITNNEVSRADLKIAGLKNDLAAINPQYRKVNIRLFEPTEMLTEDSLDFSQDSINRMIDIGYHDAYALTGD